MMYLRIQLKSCTDLNAIFAPQLLGEAVVANEGRDHDVSTSNELDLNPYRSTEKKKRQVPEYTEEVRITTKFLSVSWLQK